MGWTSPTTSHNQRIMAIVHLCVDHVMNIFRRSLVAIVNNTGVLFEILGMVVLPTFILALFHHHQGASVIFQRVARRSRRAPSSSRCSCRSSDRYGFDTAGTARRGDQGIRGVRRRRRSSVDRGRILMAASSCLHAARDPDPCDGQNGLRPGRDHRRELRQRILGPCSCSSSRRRSSSAASPIQTSTIRSPLNVA